MQAIAIAGALLLHPQDDEALVLLLHLGSLNRQLAQERGTGDGHRSGTGRVLHEVPTIGHAEHAMAPELEFGQCSLPMAFVRDAFRRGRCCSDVQRRDKVPRFL